MSVLDRVLAEIARRGPVPFAQVVEAALYDPEHGFFAAGGRAGRRGDFLTSPEVGPLFGTVVARAMDSWWVELGRPDPYVVVDAGAGPGTLARTVLAAGPRCAAALRYVLVERSAAQRRAHGAHLHLEEPALAFAQRPDEPEELVDAGAAPEPPPGPIVVSLSELPRIGGPCVVIANELLDNLPFGLAERTGAGWQEVRVGEDGGRLVEMLVPLGARRSANLEALAPDAPVGARVPIQEAAAGWLREALALAGPGGRVAVLDYTATTAELATRPWLDWVRTYRAQQRGAHPLEHLGSQDITCEVAVDQLELARPPTRQADQAAWLRGHGLDELVEEGRRVWAERAHLGDLEAVRARSRIGEAAALTDAGGLGAFQVLEWRA